MTLTDLIAFSALLVALYSAILSTCTVVKEFFRLKLTIFDTSKTCITLTKSNEYLNNYGERINTYHKDLYTLIIPVRIINKSKHNTVINEITLNNKYTLNSSATFDNFIPTSFNFEGNYITAHKTELFDYQILKPLYELKGLSSFEGYLIFSSLKEFPSHFNIKINAVQKSKTFYLHFNIANDYRNEQIQEEI